MRLSSNNNLVASTRYDANGRRVGKVVSGGITQRYIYSDVETIETFDGSNTWKQDFVFDVTGIDRVLMLEQADVLDQDGDSNTTELTRSYYHRNALGSVMEITSEGQGEVVSYRYSPYGEVTITRNGSQASGDPLVQGWTYTGRFSDEETGLHYYRARHYAPGQGSFIHRDPVGYLSGPSLYTYAWASPTNWRDPYGLLSISPETADAVGKGIAALSSAVVIVGEGAAAAISVPVAVVVAAVASVMVVGGFIAEALGMEVATPRPGYDAMEAQADLRRKKGCLFGGVEPPGLHPPLPLVPVTTPPEDRSSPTPFGPGVPPARGASSALDPYRSDMPEPQPASSGGGRGRRSTTCRPCLCHVEFVSDLGMSRVSFQAGDYSGAESCQEQCEQAADFKARAEIDELTGHKVKSGDGSYAVTHVASSAGK